MDMAKRKQLVEKIKVTFKGVPYPGDNQISPYLKTLRGQKWEDIDMSLIHTYQLDLHHLSGQSFRYFIPALMIILILEPEESDILPEGVVNLLSPYSVISEDRSFQYRVAALQDEEKVVIAEFIYAYMDLEPDGGWTEIEKWEISLSDAIEYWSQYIFDGDEKVNNTGR